MKGTAFQYIADRHGAERIYYFDPDILVLEPARRPRANAGRAQRSLDAAPVRPGNRRAGDPRQRALLPEARCLQPGFSRRENDAGKGAQFIDWWAERLRSYCYDEVENGLFTDQRWVDLAPAFFDDIAIVREPQYNVATWNLTHRRATRSRALRDPDQWQTAGFLPLLRVRQRCPEGHARSLRFA